MLDISLYVAMLVVDHFIGANEQTRSRRKILSNTQIATGIQNKGSYAPRNIDTCLLWLVCYRGLSIG